MVVRARRQVPRDAMVDKSAVKAQPVHLRVMASTQQRRVVGCELI